MTEKLDCPGPEIESPGDEKADKIPEAPAFSRQEVLILRLVATGVPTCEIARQLSTTEDAVKEHVKSVLSQVKAWDKRRRTSLPPKA